MTTLNDLYDSGVDEHIIDLIESFGEDPDSPILTPTASNNDVDGSQHSGGSNFTYEDASESDIENATSLGWYSGFSNYGGGDYTGNQYDGYGPLFSAVVVNPPEYVVDIWI